MDQLQRPQHSESTSQLSCTCETDSQHCDMYNLPHMLSRFLYVSQRKFGEVQQGMEIGVVM